MLWELPPHYTFLKNSTYYRERVHPCRDFIFCGICTTGYVGVLSSNPYYCLIEPVSGICVDRPSVNEINHTPLL